MRVVSLVPSWTEFLHDLDVNVVGQTKFCVRPQTAFRTLPRVGGTKTVKLDAVLGLEPDLVVANREENDREQIETLMAAMPSERVVVTDVRTVEHALDEMRRLGEAVDRNDAADDMIQRTRNAWGRPRSRWWAVLGMSFGLPRGWWLDVTPSSTASWRIGASRMP